MNEETFSRYRAFVTSGNTHSIPVHYLQLSVSPSLISQTETRSEELFYFPSCTYNVWIPEINLNQHRTLPPTQPSG